MKKAYSYIRFSSDKQAQGDSVRRQSSQFDRWLKNNPEYQPDEKTIEDFGISAAKGDNLNPKKSNLGKFIQLCQRGKIESGSVLVLERVDRFSRKHTFAVAEIIRELVEDCGISIAFLQPTEMTLTPDNLGDTMQTMTFVMSLQLAYDESEKKSERVGARWSQKKKNLKAGDHYTNKIPAWLKFDKDGNIIQDRPKCKTINKIFDLSVKGMGCKNILYYLNENNIKPITEPTKRTPVPRWSLSYISQLLNDRRLIGELQPKTQRGVDRKRFDGKAIPNYFPVVINEDLFNHNLVEKKQRRTLKVVKNRKFVNLFIGLITCTSDGRKMTAISNIRTRNGKTTRKRYLISTGRRNGTDYCGIQIEYSGFESLMLGAFQELRMADLLIPEKSNEDLKVIRNNIEATKDRIKLLEDKLQDDKYTSEFDTLLDLKIKAKDKLSDLQNNIDNYSEPQKRTPKETKELLKEFKRQTSDPKLHYELRQKMAHVIPTIIEKINLTPVRYNRRTYCFGEIILRSGGVRKFIHHPTGVKYRVYFADKKNNPTVTISKEGVVANEKNVTAAKNFEVFAKVKQHKDEDPSFLGGMIKSFNETFGDGEYHGEKNWHGIKDHLHADIQDVN